MGTVHQFDPNIRKRHQQAVPYMHEQPEPSPYDVAGYMIRASLAVMLSCAAVAVLLFVAWGIVVGLHSLYDSGHEWALCAIAAVALYCFKQNRHVAPSQASPSTLPLIRSRYSQPCTIIPFSRDEPPDDPRPAA